MLKSDLERWGNEVVYKMDWLRTSLEAGTDVGKWLQFMGVLIRMQTADSSKNVKEEKIFEVDVMGVD